MINKRVKALPLNFELALTAIALSFLSGLASYLQGSRDGRMKRGFLSLLTELTLSIATGLCVMYIGIWKESPPALTCALILILTLNGGDSINKAKDFVFTLATSRYK